MSEEEKKLDPTVERMRVLMERKGWSHNQTARYLGVPVGTFGNWIQGTRKPDRVVARLLDVLALVETFAPMVNDHLITAATKGK